ncbi:MAG: helix-turn-helix transcriptional regulator [Ruminococcaceae bacterium]|nr:helix-turn-helix transcriptional regulator [Oscillospiraceae bacterium]
MKNSIPYLRYIDKRYIKNYDELVIAYDYRLFYIAEGGIKITIENNSFSLIEKSLIVIPPAVAYKISDCKKDTLVYILNFDLDSKNAIQPPMSPDNPATFDIYKAIIPEITDFKDIHFENNAVWAEDILKTLAEENEFQKLYYTEIKNAYLKILLLNLKREKINIHIPDIINEIKNYIEENCLENPSIKKISQKFGYHPLYLTRIFKLYTGKTIHTYLLEHKLKQAKTLVSGTEKTIYEIAEMTGFSTSEYFSKVFKKYFGCTPSQIRKQNKLI